VCGLADDDVAVGALLLQPRRDVDGIADDLGVAAHHDFAGVDGNPQSDRSYEGGVLLGKFAKRAMHFECRMHGARRIVFGHSRCTENGKHPVAEKLGDSSAVGSDGTLHRIVVTLHEGAHRLCIETLMKRSRTREVGEHDRDDFALAL